MGGDRSSLYWTRERAKSGPADTLNTRWEIQRSADGTWVIYDNRNRQVVSEGHRLMREARKQAEVIVAGKYGLVL